MLTWNVADVYGLSIDNAGWYLKVCIEDVEEDDVNGDRSDLHAQEVLVISLHPLERPIKSNGGWVRP